MSDSESRQDKTELRNTPPGEVREERGGTGKAQDRKAEEIPSSGGVNLRGVVLDILIEHEMKGTYSNILIRRAQDRYSFLPLSQRAFIKRLAEGTIERQMELDAVIDRHRKNKEIPVKRNVRCILRMSIYQIYYMDSVPDHAACDEAVRLCRKRHLESQAGFVNALLRTVCREKAANLRGGKDAADPVPAGRAVVAAKDEAESVRTERLSRRYSIPAEILELWQEQLGGERLEPLCRAMLETRPVCIRMNSRLTEDEKNQLIRQFEEAGVRVQPGRWEPDCRCLQHIPGLTKLPGFAGGLWTVQDESSQLTAHAAGLKGRRGGDIPEDAVILDLCAAPGGKTILAAMERPEGRIVSYDLSREKTDRIRANVRRMNLSNVTVGENDASNLREDLKESADLVICDVPCSGLGVMTRKRDIKYNVTPQMLRSLTALQRRIARNAAQMVKPGGVLLYSTCTINRLENERIAGEIARRTDLEPEELTPFLPEGFPGIEGNCVQLFPDVHGTDGFFMARFRRPFRTS